MLPLNSLSERSRCLRLAHAEKLGMCPLQRLCERSKSTSDRLVVKPKFNDELFMGSFAPAPSRVAMFSAVKSIVPTRQSQFKVGAMRFKAGGLLPVKLLLKSERERSRVHATS